MHDAPDTLVSSRAGLVAGISCISRILSDAFQTTRFERTLGHTQLKLTGTLASYRQLVSHEAPRWQMQGNRPSLCATCA